METHGSLRDKLMEVERAEILGALQRTGWVKARAARLLGITERMIGYKVRKYGMKKEVVPAGERGEGPETTAH
jgi:Nif-specific regulatory protein